jgi:adenylosuccinate synthase
VEAVVVPLAFIKELDAFGERRNPGKAYVSHAAHLVLSHHRKNNESGGFVGTTERGIGPATATRRGARVCPMDGACRHDE